MTMLERIADLPRASRAMSWVVIMLFGAFVLTPPTAQMFGWGERASTENRVLAAFPQVSDVSDALSAPRRLEAYVKDRFGLRQQMIVAYSWLRLQLGLSSVKDVAVGSGGWLFYTSDKLLEQHTGVNRFAPAELEHWVAQMEAIHSWLGQQGIPFYILVAPDKNTAYPELLPRYPLKVGATRRIDQIAERMARSPVPFIDPRVALAEAKARGVETYFSGDSHWTEHGAFIAYSELMRKIRERFPEVSPLRLSDYERYRGKPMAADLDRLLSLEGILPHEVERFRLQDATRQTALPRTSMRPGWGWRVEEFTNNLRSAPRILVFGDSFTTYVMGPNMLYATFRDPVWTHNNGGTLNMDLVREFKPDLVVMQIADRYLLQTPLKAIGLN
jgi:alginate O-acetyltransferase complex protein AlgJ